MKNKKVQSIYWGIVLIAVSVLVILKCVGVDLGFLGALSVVDIALGLIVVSITVMSIVKLHLWVIPFELAVIFMLFESEIGEHMGNGDGNLINNWLLISCAALMSVGISLLFTPKQWKWNTVTSNKVNHNATHGSSSGHNVKFGSETKYIDCINFDTFSYSVRMGDGNLFFSNIEEYKGGGVLNVDCYMGNMEINVPSSWDIDVKIDSSLGNVDYDDISMTGGPTLTVQGTCRMGNMEINRC